MPTRKTPRRTAKLGLDKVSGKGRRGRKGVPRAEICGRADHLRVLLEQCWDQVGDELVKATNKEDVIQAFERTDDYHRRFFVPGLAPLILEILAEQKFPKTRTARIGFLSDSLAADGRVSPRRSRDICSAERQRLEPHRILCREPYIVSDGWKVYHFSGPRSAIPRLDDHGGGGADNRRTDFKQNIESKLIANRRTRLARCRASGIHRQGICDRVLSSPEPDLLRPGEDSPPLRGKSFPGATLPWALPRILHAPPKVRNAASGDVSPADHGHAVVC